MSDSSVMIFRDKVLKIQKLNKEAENEYGMLLYLQGMLPVPQVYAWEKENGTAYLLMEKCAGEMACSDNYMADPVTQCRLLAAGMKKMWDMDISDCTFDQSLSHKLAQAEINVKSGLVDLDNVEEIMDAGANVFVVGTKVFRGDITQNVKNFKNKFYDIRYNSS